ncbi:MAG: hypothetical protein RLZZ144_380 [Pseudomonadota bacterium]|jgi:hypothetical protein
MRNKMKLTLLAVSIGLATGSSMSYASEAALNLSLPSATVINQEAKFFLAANESSATPEQKAAAKAVAKTTPEYDAPLWVGSNLHKYLGLATIGAALGTMMTASEGCEHNCTNPAPRDVTGTHATMAKTTAVLAAATVVTGLVAHWDDFALEDGWTDPDNLHVLLGTAGAVLLGYATMVSANSSTPVSHAGMAELGALGMGVAIALTW